MYVKACSRSTEVDMYMYSFNHVRRQVCIVIVVDVGNPNMQRCLYVAMARSCRISDMPSCIDLVACKNLKVTVTSHNFPCADITSVPVQGVPSLAAV